MAAIEKAATSVQRCAVAYAFTGVPWLAIYCHCRLGILIQVSVHRISTSKGLPAASVPLLLGKVNEGAVRLWRKDPGERSNSSLPSRSASLQEQR